MPGIYRRPNQRGAGVCVILVFNPQRGFFCGLCLNWVRAFACCTLFSSAVVSGSTNSTTIACACEKLRPDESQSGCSVTENVNDVETRTVRALRGICSVWGVG